MTCVGDVNLLWGRGRPRIGPNRQLGPFCSGGHAQSRLGYNFPDGVEDNIWLSEMHIVIRIDSHHLSALRRQFDEIRLHVFPGILDPRLRFFGESLESIVTTSRDDDERNIQDTPCPTHLGHALFQGQGLAAVGKGHRIVLTLMPSASVRASESLEGLPCARFRH